MKRVKHTRYPVERCQQLVVAISQDLSEQLHKVLRQYSLMHIRSVQGQPQKMATVLCWHSNLCSFLYSMAEFEKVYASCTRLNQTWTEQDDTLRQQLRDMMQVRRKGKERLPPCC